ncbi:MAG: hypothetical protein J7623_16395 [Chitinophaga sp.]|uniref:hypothetical protein n=1 Tax=Chitinophaga sp. TaxID=1869181 RepID=UPI001B09702C|nr:hypothetical protein [Chitinophaga sp.]MBO9730221.1 hypothetical protein [Chitinophaga sp.]
MLQNRVDPYGRLIFTQARGAWMGNRGILHDEQQQVLRPFKLKAWITCVLEFKNRHRTVMAPHRYTELFFRDEATSFAAGHRPCYECRRADYNRFKTYWLKGNPEYDFDDRVSIQEIDKILHRERITPRLEKVTYIDTLLQLPDGCFIVYEQQPCLVYEQALYRWSPDGYTKKDCFPKDEQVQVLTPLSVVSAFRAGYNPQVIIR